MPEIFTNNWTTLPKTSIFAPEQKYDENERIRVPFASFKAYFQVEKLWFFGGVSGGFKYFPFSPLEKINPASVKNHLGPMRIAIYEEHIAIFYSVAYCPTKTPQYTHGKNIFVLYILCHSWTGEQDNNGVFSQPRVHISCFFPRFSVEKNNAWHRQDGVKQQFGFHPPPPGFNGDWKKNDMGFYKVGPLRSI